VTDVAVVVVVVVVISGYADTLFQIRVGMSTV